MKLISFSVRGRQHFRMCCSCLRLWLIHTFYSTNCHKFDVSCRERHCCELHYYIYLQNFELEGENGVKREHKSIGELEINRRNERKLEELKRPKALRPVLVQFDLSRTNEKHQWNIRCEKCNDKCTGTHSIQFKRFNQKYTNCILSDSPPGDTYHILSFILRLLACSKSFCDCVSTKHWWKMQYDSVSIGPTKWTS